MVALVPLRHEGLKSGFAPDDTDRVARDPEDASFAAVLSTSDLVNGPPRIVGS